MSYHNNACGGLGSCNPRTLATNSSWCKNLVAPAKACAPLEVYERSYPLALWWPLERAAVHLVMEADAAGTCDFYRMSPKTCCGIATKLEYVERHVFEVLVTTLSGCSNASTPCHAVDLGANNGWFTAIMLALDAHVIAVEPQSDFARAIRETAALNCWANRSLVVNAFAGRTGAEKARKPGNTWRAGAPDKYVRKALQAVPGVALPDILLRPHLLEPALTGGETCSQSQWPVHYALVKLDGDGPEFGWLATIVKLVRGGHLSVGAMIFEGNTPQIKGMNAVARARFAARVMVDLQTLGYTVYRLQSNYRMSRSVNKLQRAAFEDEVVLTRTMRHVYRAREGLSMSNWSTLLHPISSHWFLSI